ncbi:hypothetical protein KM295_11410 [Natronomonas sp. F2-12]|jgi:hypothetical protein|uniref:Uncharacterized protein n=1 Tax=Natronomonas aquatica TaxID=2841590 RepID=A0A9R1D7Q5_9EURY|nr:hypothetical protein [Natronomonas aquatica]MCQ4334075.1 hypothetical protein [Natronomonas aquatica]
MNTNYLIGGLLVVLVASVLGVALYAGMGPAPGGGSGEEIEEFPTEGDADDGTDATLSDDTEPFSFTIDDIEECGETCRDVTATLDNNQNGTATDVTVYIRIFAGEGNTETGDVVWEDIEDVGEMDAGGTHTTTKRVELSLQDGRSVERNNGWITILTTVESDDTTVTFQESRQVA